MLRSQLLVGTVWWRTFQSSVQELFIGCYSMVVFGVLLCFIMIIIVMIMIIIMIFFIIIIVIITQPLVGSLFPVAIWLADFLSPSCPACAPLPRSLWRV